MRIEGEGRSVEGWGGMNRESGRGGLGRMVFWVLD